MNFNNITPVVKNLLIINALMFLAFCMNFGMTNLTGISAMLDEYGNMMVLRYFESNFFKPYQIVTHAFLHADFQHLFFNMFALFMFGPILEMTWGPKRFLQYYLFTALGAAILHSIVSYFELHYLHQQSIMNSGVLGASGAVFGLLLGYGVYYPNNVIQLLLPPIPLKAKYFVMIYAGLELFLGVGSFNTGVAHFAHLGGALFGLIMIWYWRSRGTR